MINFSHESEYNQNLSTNDVELTDVTLAGIHGGAEQEIHLGPEGNEWHHGQGGHGWHHGWHHGWGGPAYGGGFYGGPVYGGGFYGGPVYTGAACGGPVYTGVVYASPVYNGGCGC